MNRLKGTLTSPEATNFEAREVVVLATAAAALKGALVPEAVADSDVAEVGSPTTVKNRDSGVEYYLIGKVEKPDGRVTLRFEATDSSGARVTIPESRLNEALATDGGAWSSVKRVE